MSVHKITEPAPNGVDTLPERLCEFEKAVRDHWVTKAEIEDLTGWNRETVKQWCDAFEAHGRLLSREGPPELKPARGVTPRQYRLAVTWGGVES